MAAGTFALPTHPAAADSRRAGEGAGRAGLARRARSPSAVGALCERTCGARHSGHTGRDTAVTAGRDGPYPPGSERRTAARPRVPGSAPAPAAPRAAAPGPEPWVGAGRSRDCARDTRHRPLATAPGGPGCVIPGAAGNPRPAGTFRTLPEARPLSCAGQRPQSSLSDAGQRSPFSPLGLPGECGVESPRGERREAGPAGRSRAGDAESTWAPRGHAGSAAPRPGACGAPAGRHGNGAAPPPAAARSQSPCLVPPPAPPRSQSSGAVLSLRRAWSAGRSRDGERCGVECRVITEKRTYGPCVCGLPVCASTRAGRARTSLSRF